MDSDDDFYPDVDDYNYMDSEDDACDEDYLDYSVNNLQPHQQNYTMLSEAYIRSRQDQDITTLSTVLSISKSWASILLRHYNWSISNVEDAWFGDREKVCKSLGLLGKPIVPIQEKVQELTCGICFEIFSLDKMNACACGHFFCVSCWTGYISTSIKDGSRCLMLRCPDPSCNVAIEQDLIDEFTSDEDKEKFSYYLLRSYIELNRKTKWCPAPDCAYAVELDIDSTSSYDVTCRCSYSFCWNCSEEVHRPVDCDTVAKWILKDRNESENMEWLLSNSKLCPKCKKQIEKDQGCLHMTCACGYEFCWLCLGPWSQHDFITGGFDSCNIFLTAKVTGNYDEVEKKREMAKNSLDKYIHYYERWANNQLSTQKALEDLQKIQSGKFKEVSLKEILTDMEIDSIMEAWVVIVECRQVLKWTYAYGYYIPEDEDGKREFFEYLQGEAESGLEKLHHCVEKELKGYLEVDGLIPGFHEFLTKQLVGLTKVTRNYFDNLVQALENGLSDITCVRTGRLKSLGENLEGDKDKGKLRRRRTMKYFAWCSCGWLD